MDASQLLRFTEPTDASILGTLVRRTVLAQRVHILAGMLRSVRSDRHMGKERGMLFGGVVLLVWNGRCGQNVVVLVGHEILVVGLQMVLLLLLLQVLELLMVVVKILEERMMMDRWRYRRRL